MKLFKRLFSYLVALTMVLSLATLAGVDVHAATPSKYDLTIDNTSKGHIFNIYQILKGDVSGTQGNYVLSNAKWGSGVTSIKISDTETITATAGANVSDTDMKKIASIDKSEIASRITLSNSKYADAIKVDSTNPTSVTFNVEGGYYVVTDTAPAADTGTKTTKTYTIVQVVGPTTIHEKSGTIESEKKVEDKNDSDGTTTSGQNSNNLLGKSELGDSADYDIGDSINYTIEAKLPENYASYKKFPLTFVDTMSEGLTYNNDAKLYFGKADTTGLSVSGLTEEQFKETTAKVEYSTSEASTTPDKNTATKYSWAIKNLIALATANGKTLAAGDIVYITYSATLNSHAAIGSAGNPNKMHLEYNNNPESDSPTETPDKTPDDTNIVFTYEAVFNKVDQDNKPLSDADFTLYKFVKGSGTDTYKVGENTYTGTWVDVTNLGSDGNNPTKTVDTYTNKNGTAKRAKFTFKGIDDGYYKLHESNTPAGYNTMEDKYFTINADHEIQSDDPQLKKLSTTGGLTLTGEKGVLSTEIVNKSGSILPSTGGMGTTLLYVAGGILVACAAAYVVLNKKHAK